MLSVNIVVSLILTFMSKHQNQDRKSASVVMINTSCEKVSQIDTSVHLLMNIFSAALLGATVSQHHAIRRAVTLNVNCRLSFTAR